MWAEFVKSGAYVLLPYVLVAVLVIVVAGRVFGSHHSISHKTAKRDEKSASATASATASAGAGAGKAGAAAASEGVPPKYPPRLSEEVWSKRVYSATEVAKHNKRHDCWLIIKDRVYDMSSYVDEHPGGDEILNNAGADSTKGFFKGQHPDNVEWNVLPDFCIGVLQR